MSAFVCSKLDKLSSWYNRPTNTKAPNRNVRYAGKYQLISRASIKTPETEITVFRWKFTSSRFWRSEPNRPDFKLVSKTIETYNFTRNVKLISEIYLQVPDFWAVVWQMPLRLMSAVIWNSFTLCWEDCIPKAQTYFQTNSIHKSVFFYYFNRISWKNILECFTYLAVGTFVRLRKLFRTLRKLASTCANGVTMRSSPWLKQTVFSR